MTNLSPWLGRVTCGDCLELLRELPDGCVDAVVTDPPYGTGTAEWDLDPPPEVWQQLRRVCPQGPLAVWGYPECHLRWARHFDGLQVIGSVAWWHYNHPKATNGMTRHWQQIVIWGRSRKQVRAGDVREPYGDSLVSGRLSEKWVHRGGQFATTDRAQLTSGSCHPDGRRMTDVWRIPTPGAGFNSHLRQHPNEKPMEACERLVRLLTDEGGTVLDCYAGSGTAPAAAVLWGRQFIGFELDPHYCEIANARIAHAQAEAASRLPLEVATGGRVP